MQNKELVLLLFIVPFSGQRQSLYLLKAHTQGVQCKIQLDLKFTKSHSLPKVPFGDFAFKNMSVG